MHKFDKWEAVGRAVFENDELVTVCEFNNVSVKYDDAIKTAKVIACIPDLLSLLLLIRTQDTLPTEIKEAVDQVLNKLA